jgi:hypothetical protein
VKIEWDLRRRKKKQTWSWSSLAGDDAMVGCFVGGWMDFHDCDSTEGWLKMRTSAAINTSILLIHPYIIFYLYFFNIFFCYHDIGSKFSPPLMITNLRRRTCATHKVDSPLPTDRIFSIHMSYESNPWPHI